ncbi:MAG: MotA/TolQ/ExbB proton channel family protein [Isosphaeraceae bacterium]|nr:MotA/TolQ/ExbB proton channel family protein [Isosphaeraceae bacterium]
MPTLPLSTSSRNGRAWAWALFVLGSLACLSLAQVPAARAQEEKKEAAAEAAPAEAAPAAPATSEATAPPAKKSMLMWALEASGPIGIVLLIISVYMSAMIIRFFLEMKVSEAVPPALVEKLETAIKERKFQEAYDACRDNESFLARLVRTGVANLPNGRPEAKESMNVVADEIVTGLEAKVGYLAIIGQLGPMIGLVGTIFGMIMSFQEIATAAGSQPKPEKVAEGISTALFITLEGVSLAVPAIYFYAFFKNKIALLTMEATKVADRTINSLVAAAKQAKPS